MELSERRNKEGTEAHKHELRIPPISSFLSRSRRLQKYRSSVWTNIPLVSQAWNNRDMSRLVKKTVRTVVYGVMFAATSLITLLLVNKGTKEDVEFIHTTRADVPYGQASYYGEASYYAEGGYGGGDGDGGGGGDDGGDSDSDGCFVAGTRVLLADGRKVAIETIEPGSLVQGLGKTFKVMSLIVHDGIHAFSHDYSHEPLMEITFDNGAILKTVGGHPVYVKKGNYWSWGNMWDLKIGAEALTERGEVSSVISARMPNEAGKPILYNLELDVEPYEERSFYANGILVRETQHINLAISKWLSPERVLALLRNRVEVEERV